MLPTLTQRRVLDRTTLPKVSAHPDMLVARASGGAPPPFWDDWSCLHQEDGQRMPA